MQLYNCLGREKEHQEMLLYRVYDAQRKRSVREVSDNSDQEN